ncbi:NUDIX hydrolase [Pseudomonas anguilliseptica]|uniref:Isopentenyldiphosphate isomerase n=1 Tax=Pseudomonas anguilliseptica TaxID=53406 RepID=A0A1H4RJT0_PSEAG|nr:NUDIX hydrolase [Pseudomonas anguilliseptica]SEC32078.1 Isopentenyldiphosphate isomerase [Pseudomonas anguilliseptica]
MAWSEAEVAHRAASDAERIVWVDEEDRPLGGVLRSELRARHLLGRGTYILLFNSAGLLCVHRRTLSKALYPGYWDVAAGGMVLEGESYAESAARELAEELGIEDAQLVEHAHFLYDAPESRLWCMAYSAVSDAPLRLQPEEVLEARFISIDEALAETQYLPYCPDSLAALQRYLAATR